MNKEIMQKVANIKHDVELKSEKVELGLVDNLKKYPVAFKNMQSELQGINKSAGDLKAKLRSIKTELNSFGNVVNSFLDDASSDLVKFEKAAKDLGINPKDSKEYLEAEKAYKNLINLEKAANRVREDIVNI